MASTSASSSVPKRFKYDVFLSFRVEDINFVNNLCDALKKSDIYTYKGLERIEKRRKISDELIRSIEESRFHIIVFSKNYASSSLCLEELVKIMECQKTMDEQTVFPVFYDVEPTEVRNQSGPVGKAFVKLEYEEGAGRWRNAMKKTAGLAGWEWKTIVDGHEEAKFIQKIVEEIFLKPYFVSRSIDKKLVGMETRVKDLVISLKAGVDDVRMIGIRGVGGGGKTTLAKAVFDHISIWFESKSFVSNVRETFRSSSSGLKELQRQVLQDVLNSQSIDVTHVSDGKKMMKEVMGSRKVLVVLDDVDHIDQLEMLAGSVNWFKPGSRIIITTRDQQLLLAHGVHINNIHRVSLLSDEEALCLFSRRAFGRGVPNQGYEELSRKVVRYSDGLPLTIIGLGSVHYRNEDIWIDIIERLKTIPFMENLYKLMLSYDSLEFDCKEIFLDVACFIKGETKKKAIRILESCGYSAETGLRVLEQKSLISISNFDRLLMNAHMEEMGKSIVRRHHPGEPNKHSRLWIKEEIEEILVNELGTERIQSIKLDTTDLHPARIMEGLRNMKKLRFLYVDNGYNNWKVDDVSPFLPNALRYLYWCNYPFGCLPKTFLADELVNLEMTWSKISQLWGGGERKILKALRFLNLSGSKLSNLDLGMTPNLEELHLRECNDFEDLHVSVECRNLKLLVLGCPVLTKLNLGLIPNLKELFLEECNDLVELHLPVKPPKLTLSSKEIEHLPNSICMLKHLVFLELNFCSRLEQLPQDLDRLECLEELYLTNCISLRDIPSSICKMKYLKSLHLPYCIRVKELPGELGQLKCLKELNIEGAGVRHLPQSIIELKGLHIVGSRGRLESYGLKSLEEISSYTAFCDI